MPLDPLRIVYVQPAPKSRLAVTGLFAYEDHKREADQKQIKGFPAEAGPTEVGANVIGCTRALCGTGFSREGAGVGDGNFTA